MARILGVGIATLDIVNTVQRYPAEDTEIRAVGHRVSRGGNATNTLVVLGQLGHDCAWAGVIADGADGQRVLDDLARYGIDTEFSRALTGGTLPTSYITLSQETGTRTIVHYRDLPEYGFDDFGRVDLQAFDWLHFEGRNVGELRPMLERARALATGIPRSVEIEKSRPEVESLFRLADVILFSRQYAREAGFDHAPRFLEKMASRAPAATLICAWGEEGAYARSPGGESAASPAFPPAVLVDTLGAGDVFNGAVIDGLVTGQTLETTLIAACRLAGRKCGQEGLDGLAPPTESVGYN